MTAKTDTPAEAEPPQPERPMPTNVIAALARIMEELPAIAKKKHPSPDGDRGVTYPYRGIEEITAEAQGLFAKYGVVAIPWKTVPIETREFQTQKGTTWTDEKIEIHWRIYGPGGTDDMIEAQTLGIGRDNSDKGWNKGATAAFKYLLLPMLMVADPKDDNDGKTQENDGGQKSQTTRRAAPRRANVPDGQETAPARWEQKDAANASTDDVATMGAREVAEALRAAGLEAAGSLPQMRLRLQEHRSGVGGAKPAATSNGKTEQADPNLATEKQLGFVNSLFAGYEDEERYAAIGDIIGREIASSKELTKREASQVIELMKSDADA